MALPLRATLLGRPSFAMGKESLPSASRKVLWLAAYVLLTRARHPRNHLATLLWGGDSPRHAQGSLRVALTKLPAGIASALEITREHIGAAGGHRVDLDVDEFIASCGRDEVESLRRAVALYGGDLLEGVEGDVAAEFSDWLLPERSRLRKLAHDAHLKLAQRLLASGERDDAREVAEAWLRRDPAAEEMHKLMMLSLGGDQALAHYELYRRARAVAHGAAPSEAMAALVERVRHGGEQQHASEAPARLNAATSFFGRIEELAGVRGLLADPSCRLLTLHGLGGVGKTRLAIALADLESAAFPDGVHVVALEGLLSPRLFAATLARACGLQPSGAASPLQLAASFLRDRAALLVLDNMEHLLGEDDASADSLPAQVAALLRDTGPRLKVLATSREPLRLQEEWIYELEGLAHPRDGAADGAEAQAYPAVQFFAQRARQAYVGFSVAAELPNVVRICGLLEGLPLGLELAASWVRTVPSAEIAAALRDRAGELRNRHVNRTARHDSLTAVVAYSWERLPAEQREALAALAAFHGTFSREAAEKVALAGLRALSALTEKALLQRAGGGRWRVHEVVRQFAWQHPDATARARASHQAAVVRRRDAFYVDYLDSMRVKLEGPDEPEALDAIEEDVANARAAWDSCARAGDAAALARAAPAWLAFLESRGFVGEGCNAAAQWLAAAQSVPRHPSVERARATLGHFEQFATNLTCSLEILDACVAALEPAGNGVDLAFAITERALTLAHLGRLAEGEEVAARAIAMAEALGDRQLLAQALTVRGIIVVRSGKGAEARELQRRALEIVSAHGNPSLVARVQNNLALAENYLGHYRAAEAGYEGALALWKELRATRFMGLATHNLGVVAERMGNFALALERYRAALDLFKRVGDRKMIAINLMSTGDSLVRIGRPGEARAPLEEALRIAQRDQHGLPVAYSHAMLAHAAVAMGQSGEAASQLERAFEAAQLGNFTDVQAEAVVGVARLVAAAAPAFAPPALAWMQAMAGLAKASSRVRDDAHALVDLFTVRGIAAADLDTPCLEDLVAAAREMLRRLSPSPATLSRAPSSAPAATRA